MDAPGSSPQSPLPPGGQPLFAVIWGPRGLRAGWRLLIFFTILFALFSGERAAIKAIRHGHTLTQLLTPLSVLREEAVSFFNILLATGVMARIERRKISGYGLPWRQAFRAQFWQGAAISFASITALLLALRAANVFHFGAIALHGAALWRYAVLWGLAFLFVGFSEEFTFRGYALFTLSDGLGFWPAAILLSALFGYVHHGNSDENVAGLITAGAVGFLFCLLVRRTGNLWMPIGFHAAWDWGESYFYGVADSGQLVQGHLFNASFSGPAWLTGGAAGPEGSWLCILLLVFLWLIFSRSLRGAKYPPCA